MVYFRKWTDIQILHIQQTILIFAEQEVKTQKLYINVKKKMNINFLYFHIKVFLSPHSWFFSVSFLLPKSYMCFNFEWTCQKTLNQSIISCILCKMCFFFQSIKILVQKKPFPHLHDSCFLCSFLYWFFHDLCEIRRRERWRSIQLLTQYLSRTP